MMTNDPVDAQDSFIIPSRTLRGSKREMVQDIDQAIVGLLALRQLINGGATPPGDLDPGGRRRPLLRRLHWPRLFAGLRQVRLAG
jgi:hypothetical protein